MIHHVRIAGAKAKLPRLERYFSLTDDFVLETSREVPVIELRANSNRPVGWLIGYPILNEIVLNASLELPEHPECVCGAWEQVWQNLAGRYAAIICSEDGGCWVYPDASASFSLFFSREVRMAASHVELLPQNLVRPANEIEELKVLTETTSHICIAGLTSRRGVHPLLPNHRINLSTGLMVRFNRYRRNQSQEAEKNIALICKRIQNTLCAVRKIGLVTLNLTAGRDSRMLLACALDTKTAYHFHTTPSKVPDKEPLDNQIARAIVDEFDLKASLDCVPSDHILAQGLGGEVGRCFYWLKSDRTHTSISWRDALRRTGSDAVPFGEESFFRDWWLGLPDEMDAFDRLDHLYIEYRLGCTMGPAMHGHDRNVRFAFFPFNDPQIYIAMLNLPSKFRQSDGLFRSVLKQKEPRLLAFPANAPTLSFPLRHMILWSLAIGETRFRLHDKYRQAMYLRANCSWATFCFRELGSVIRFFLRPFRR